MKEITIAQIREKANDIETLNQGHLLYKNKEYSNFKYKFAKYQGIVLEGEANFAEFKTSLSVGDKIHSSCSFKVIEALFKEIIGIIWYLLKFCLTSSINVSMIALISYVAIKEISILPFNISVSVSFNKK